MHAGPVTTKASERLTRVADRGRVHTDHAAAPPAPARTPTLLRLGPPCPALPLRPLPSRPPPLTRHSLDDQRHAHDGREEQHDGLQQAALRLVDVDVGQLALDPLVAGGGGWHNNNNNQSRGGVGEGAEEGAGGGEGEGVLSSKKGGGAGGGPAAAMGRRPEVRCGAVRGVGESRSSRACMPGMTYGKSAHHTCGAVGLTFTAGIAAATTVLPASVLLSSHQPASVATAASTHLIQAPSVPGAAVSAGG